MAISKDTSAAGAALRNIVERQSWVQEHSNFVTTLVGFLATVAAWAATQPFATDPRVQTGILLVGFLATSFGVSVTPNGFSKSQLDKVHSEQARIIGSTKLAVPEYRGEEQELEQDTPSLDEQVREFNSSRFDK